MDRLQLPPGYTLVGFGKGKVVYLSTRDAKGIHLKRVRLKWPITAVLAAAWRPDPHEALLDDFVGFVGFVGGQCAHPLARGSLRAPHSPLVAELAKQASNQGASVMLSIFMRRGPAVDQFDIMVLLSSDDVST